MTVSLVEELSGKRNFCLTGELGQHLLTSACMPTTTIRADTTYVSFCCVKFVPYKMFQMMMMIFWVLTPCRLVARCQRFGETYCLHLQGWRLRQYVSPQRWHLATNIHGAKSHSNNIFILTTVETSNLTFQMAFLELIQMYFYNIYHSVDEPFLL
jgi:hypothetical protein